MKPISTAIVFLSILSACGSKGKQQPELLRMSEVSELKKAPAPAEKSADANMDAPQSTGNGQHSKEVSKKIIKEGDMSFETNNLSVTRNTIVASVQRLGGYIAEESQTNDGDNSRKQYNLKIRVPAAKFDQFVNGVSAAAAKIDSKNIRVRDVTTQYIDIAARLANKKRLEEQYLELLKKGTRMADLLEIEAKLTEIRTDIESTQGELNYLVEEVDYSSLDITFYNRQIIQDNGQTFGSRLTSALADGWNILVVLFFAIIEVWPLWIIGVAAYFVVKAWRKKYPVKKAGP